MLDTPPAGNVTTGRDAVLARVRGYVETSVTTTMSIIPKSPASSQMLLT
jgi:hypothetical protein